MSCRIAVFVCVISEKMEPEEVEDFKELLTLLDEYESVVCYYDAKAERERESKQSSPLFVLNFPYTVVGS